MLELVPHHALANEILELDLRDAGLVHVVATNQIDIEGTVRLLVDRRLFEEAEAVSISIDTQRGTAWFPSVCAMVEADLRGWLSVMGIFLAGDLIEQILAEAEEALSEFVTDDGAMTFEAPAHIVTAQA